MGRPKGSKNTMGRPVIEIDKKFFESMCQFMCTEEDIAGYFKCSVDTICNYCKKTYGKTFSEVYRELSAIGKTSLRNAMFKNAVKRNNTNMQIFLAKNYLGMSDKTEQSIELDGQLGEFASIVKDMKK